MLLTIASLLLVGWLSVRLLLTIASLLTVSWLSDLTVALTSVRLLSLHTVGWLTVRLLLTIASLLTVGWLSVRLLLAIASLLLTVTSLLLFVSNFPSVTSIVVTFIAIIMFGFGCLTVTASKFSRSVLSGS